MQWTRQSSKFIFIFVISLAILGWGALRISAFQQQLPELLSKKFPQLTYQQSHFTLFPAPIIQLDNVVYQYKERYQLSAKKVEGEISWYDLLMNNAQLSSIKLVDTQLKNRGIEPLFSHVNANLKLSSRSKGGYYLELEAKSLQQGNIELETNISLKPNGVSVENLNIEVFFKQGILFNRKNFTLFAKHGSLSEHQMIEQLQLSDVIVNQLPISEILVHANSANKNNFSVSHMGDISGKITFSQGELLFTSEPNVEESGYIYHLDGTALPSAALLKFFAIPQLLSGSVNIQGNALLKNDEFSSGNIEAVLDNAKINGINLSQLLAQYLPLTFSLQQKMAEYTTLNHLSLNFNWNNKQVNFNKIVGLNSQLHLIGDGKLDLNLMDCNFTLSINSNESRFEPYQLPFHFFGPCHSPQYTVKFDSKIKDEIKKIIKNKLKTY